MIKPSILFCTGIYPPEIGGPSTHVFEMSQRAEADGLEYAILTYSKPNTVSASERNVTRIPWTFFILSYFNYFLRVLRLGKKYDVIYLQGSFLEGIPTIFANLFLKKRVVIRIGGIFSWEYSFNNGWTSELSEDFLKKKQCFKSELLKSIDRFVISRCNRVIANSRYTKKLLISNRVKEEKIVVIHNPLHPFIPQGPHTNEKIDLPDGKKIFLTIGRLVPWKNFDKLITFTQKTPDNCFFLIIGSGPEKDKLTNLIKRNSLENKVGIRDVASKDQLHDLYQTAEAVILISSFEGLSHVLLEAMQQNTPIIASNIEPNREVLENYSRKILIDINEKSFLEAIQKSQKGTDVSSAASLKDFDPEITYQKTMSVLCES